MGNSEEVTPDVPQPAVPAMEHDTDPAAQPDPQPGMEHHDQS